MQYNRMAVVAYARKWAYDRNPAYDDFEQLGGDCTNFASQCIYAGAGVMNYTPEFGWYYISLTDRAPAWTGVEYLYNFLTTNAGPGPYGRELPLSQAEVGDVVMFDFNGSGVSHSAIIVSIPWSAVFFGYEEMRIAAHSYDTYGRTISSYRYKSVHLIHIDGVRA